MIKLYKHQEDALKRTRGRNRVAYFHEIGTGKTFTSLAKAIEIGNPHVIVLCQKSKIADWIKAAEDMGYVGYTEKNYMQWQHYGGVFVINYDIVWRREICCWRKFTLICDESSMVSHTTSKRTKATMKLASIADGMILLSGSPCYGHYELMYSQMKMLGFEMKKTAFDSLFCNYELAQMGNRTFKVLNKRHPYKNIDILMREIDKLGADWLKASDCFELPEQTFHTVVVDNIPAYRRFAKDRVVTVDDTEYVGDTSLTMMLRMRQLSAVNVNSAKLNAIKDIVESTNERVVIFYNFDAEFRCLLEMCNSLERPVCFVNGRGSDMGAWKEENAVILCQYQAAAKGLNLQDARIMIYASPTQSADDRIQSKGRTHRLGQQKHCIYYDVVVNGSIEPKVLASVERGEDYNEVCFTRDYGVFTNN